VLGSSTGIGDDLPALAVGDFHEAVEREAWPPRARISSPRRTVKSVGGLRRQEGVGLMKETGRRMRHRPFMRVPTTSSRPEPAVPPQSSTGRGIRKFAGDEPEVC
jgi:hypothetical protein